MLAVSGCGNYILIALQVLNVDECEDSELSTKFTGETRGDMKKIMACVGLNFVEVRCLQTHLRSELEEL